MQRRGTTDHFVRVLAGRRGGRIDAAALAALRLGLYELLFSEAADHAAVDQAVELAKAGTRRAARRTGAPAPLRDSSTRSCAAPRPSATSCSRASTTRPPAGAAVAHSYPQWLARDVVGGARREPRRGC